MSDRPQTTYRVLVLAKAPVAGRVKTRLAASVGDRAAAQLAAAALLDTAAAAAAAVGVDRCILAVEGDLGDAESGAALREAFTGWRLIPQRGAALGERIAAAHADAGPGAIVQIGMDTPQVTAADLANLAASLGGGELDARAVLAPADDGGWWALALQDPADAAAVATVAMSRPSTHDDTLAALRAEGVRVLGAPRRIDVDTRADAEVIAAAHPGLTFSAAWRRIGDHACG